MYCSLNFYVFVFENQFDRSSPKGYKLIFNIPFRVGADIENQAMGTNINK
jgi:hypothetical protein